MKGLRSETVPFPADDERWMRVALGEAAEAARRNDVPVGAVVVRGEEILGRGSNLKTADPTAHAEMSAIRRAAERLKSWNLSGCTLYVTLEPCPMCAGAVVNARIDRVVFGAYDPRAGAAGTLYNILRDTRLNHRCALQGGVLEGECASLLRSYFAGRRERRKYSGIRQLQDSH